MTHYHHRDYNLSKNIQNGRKHAWREGGEESPKKNICVVASKKRNGVSTCMSIWRTHIIVKPFRNNISCDISDSDKL